MSKKTVAVVHETAKKSWWSGRITALCGATAEAGTYETDTFRLFALPGPKCPDCQRIKHGGGEA